MQLNNERIPFTYQIGWTNLNKFYYGAKFSKNATPDCLFKSYFTSSKEVSRYRLLYGEPDLIEIRKTFSCPNKCVDWENRILHKIKNNPKYLNKPASINFKNAWTTGKNTVGMMPCKDLEGNTFQVKTTDPRFSTGEILSVTHKRVNVFDHDGTIINISTADYRYTSGKLKSVQSVMKWSLDKICVKNDKGETSSITRDEWNIRSDVSGNRKDLLMIKNILTGECLDIQKDTYANYDNSIWVSVYAKIMYHTPAGSFPSLALMPQDLKNKYGKSIITWCKTPDMKITRQAFNALGSPMDKSFIGKTHRELGFWSEKI